jgi:hypothetical protein
MQKHFELTYSTQKDGFSFGKAYANPRFFNGRVRRGVTRVVIIGRWPAVERAYRDAGIDVHVIAAPRPDNSGEPAPMPKHEREAVAAIPDNWRETDWAEKRALAGQFIESPVINATEAERIIEAEIKRAGPISHAGVGTDSGDQFSDEQLRELITQATGKAPHHRVGRDRLIREFNELNAMNALASEG